MAGLDRAKLAREGETAEAGMTRFAEWVRETAGEGRPVFTAYPASFDWNWVSTYLARYAPENPFGFSGVLDMKTMYLVKARRADRQGGQAGDAEPPALDPPAHAQRARRRDRAG